MDKKTRKKMGRRPLPEAQRRTRILTLRLTETERTLLEGERAKAGCRSIGDLLMRPWRRGKRG
jgi:hypothetical protein